MTQRRPLVTFDGRVRELPAGDTLADATLGTELTGLSQLGTTGIMVRTGAGTYATRTITGTTNQVNVSNGDGVLGNPTLSTPQNIHTAATPTFAGITLSGMTSGSVLFAGTGGIVSQDNAGLFYDDAANTLRVGAASTTASGGLIQLATGTTAASGILWGTDTNLYRSAANTLKTDDSFTVSGHLSANSTARFEDYVYGQTASGKLYINSDIALAAAKKLYLDTGSNTYVSEISADTINIVTGGSEIMRITQAGNILIGTTTETASNGRLQFATATTAAGGILFGTDTNLYRSAANTLKTDDSLVVSGGLSASTLTTGSIPYIGAGGAIGDNNANLFWNNGGTALLIRSNSIGTNGALQVNGTVGVGSSGTNYIRPITNADVVSLILLATQVVVGNVNSDTYSYSGGGRLAVVTNTDSHTLLDVGRNTSTNARFKVVNTTSGQAYTTFENSTTTAFRSFTVTGETIFGASSLATGEGRIHVAPHTTKAGGLYFGAANTNLYSSASGALKTDGVLTIAGITASTSSTTGALIVSGGAGIAKDSFINSVRIGRGTSSIASNIAIGESSPLGAITTGDRNIAIGSGALGAVTTTVANTAVGFAAGNAFTGQKGIFIGAYAGYGRTSGDNNIVIGGGVGTTATGAGNVILGIGSGQGLTSGAYNLTMGSSAGANITTGSSNVLIGESAGYFLTQGYQNVAIGAGAATGWYSAGAALTTGIQNTYIGAGAGKTNSTGNYNVAIGNIAGFLSTTSNNIFIGNMAGRYATTESSELFIDNQNRTNRAGDVAGAIIYGVMSATPASQTLALNAQVSLGSPEQVRVTNTASANRYITLTGSNGGNPTIDVSGGNLAIDAATDIAGALTVSDYVRISAGAVYGTEKLTVRATSSALHSGAVWQSGSNLLHTFLYSDNNVAGYTTISTSGGAIYMQHLARDAHRFMDLSSAEQVRITNTTSANRYITLTGSNGGNPTISTSAGNLAITPATVFASTISALAITGDSFIPNSATVPTNGMYLEAANNPAFAANSTKIFEYDSTGIQIAGTITTTGGATFHTTSTALTNGAGAGAGTLTNAPAAGDPTKWIGINDNGTTRYIPAW